MTTESRGTGGVTRPVYNIRKDVVFIFCRRTNTVVGYTSMCACSARGRLQPRARSASSCVACGETHCIWYRICARPVRQAQQRADSRGGGVGRSLICSGVDGVRALAEPSVQGVSTTGSLTLCKKRVDVSAFLSASTACRMLAHTPYVVWRPSRAITPPAYIALHLASVGSMKDPKHVVTIAVGSNLEDRYVNIEKALRQMEGKHEGITITGTSFLYESEPMYVLDQQKFLNCVVTVRSSFTPVNGRSFMSP